MLAVGKLDAVLGTLRPTEAEVATNSPVGRAWDSLIGTVARAQLRADELLEVVAPPRPKNDSALPTRRKRKRVAPV